MLTPYEIVSKSILPAIRGMLVQILRNKYGLKQMDISRKLYITQAAVSYYLSGSRGLLIDKLRKYRDVEEMILGLADDVFNRDMDKEEFTLRLNDIITYIMENKYICDFHQDLENGIDIESCNLCPELARG